MGETESKWRCLCWIDSTLICGNSGGDVIVLKDNKFEEVILSKNNDCSITYIQCINNNILAIGAEDCTVSFLQKSIENGITNWNLICNINISSSTSALSSSSSSLEYNNNNKKDNNNKESKDNKLYKCIPVGMSVDPSERQLLITTSNKQIYAVDISNLLK